MVFITDILRYSYKVLTEKRFRAVLTIIGIAIGPLALVMMTSTVKGYASYVESQLLALGQNTIVVTPSSGYTLTESDLKFIRSIKGVADAQPFYMAQAIIKTPSQTVRAYVYAIDPSILLKAIGNLKLQCGRFPAPNQITMATLGHSVAYLEGTGKQLFRLGDAITLLIPKVEHGGRTRLERVVVRVAGILEQYGGAMFISPDQGVFLPKLAGERLLHMKQWSGIFIVAKSPNYVSSIVNAIRNAYSDKVSIIAFQQIAKVVSSISAAMDFIAFSTSLSAFAVAVAGTAATMITSVIERTREIGVLKALGFTDGQVTAMILGEAIIMTVIGAAIGITLGSLGAYVMASHGLTISSGASKIVIRAPPKITPKIIGYTIAITLAVGVIGGIFPAYRAAKIPPAVALRYE